MSAEKSRCKVEKGPVSFLDWVLRSPVEIPPRDQWRFATVAAMLQEEDPQLDSRVVLAGADQSGPLEVTLADLRRAAARAERWRHEQGYAAGNSVLLLRLPYSSEAPLAAAAAALMAVGLRVVLPMSFDRQTLASMTAATDCRALLWCSGMAGNKAPEQANQADAMYRAVAKQTGVATFGIDDELMWHGPAADGETLPELALSEPNEADREVLVLSTSGSTGQPKLVRYAESALLRVAEAWNAAGLMSETLTGGRSICPTLSHSMGFRNVLHAVWNRQPTLLVQPEWLEEQPKKFVKLLERWLPQHITCGPALLRDLSLLAGSLQRVRTALAQLECVVSSGAADINLAKALPAGTRMANAFGMTETQQVLNTLLGPSSTRPGALGRPLPGVAVGVRYVDRQRQVGRLQVAVPFGARGYVGEADLGPWFETGDLVRVEGDDLFWIARADDDVLNTGHGVKVALADLENSYLHLARVADAAVFVAVPSRGGVGVLAYTGDRDPSATEVQQALKEAVDADHRQLERDRRDFDLAYKTVSVIGVVAGRPPRRGPGKLDREQALRLETALLAAMGDPASDHPSVMHLPAYGSERPDWRRYASPTS